MDVDRQQVQDAIRDWRDGATFDALHPLRNLFLEDVAVFWDVDAMKDLARVIMAKAEGREPHQVPVPWSGAAMSHVAEAVHECRVRLSEDLLGRLRAAGWTPGSSAVDRVIVNWLLGHGTNPDG
jgi:hypothetical protein